MNTVTQTITMTPEQKDFCTRFLARATSDPECEDVPIKFTANFGDGIEADIKVCNGDPPYVDPVLFAAGNEVSVLDCDDDVQGSFPFDYNGKQYIVIVQ